MTRDFTPEAAELGRLLAIARKRAPYTQAEVAKEFDVSQSYIAKIETGSMTVSPFFIIQLAKWYGTDWARILEKAALAGETQFDLLTSRNDSDERDVT